MGAAAATQKPTEDSEGKDTKDIAVDGNGGQEEGPVHDSTRPQTARSTAISALDDSEKSLHRPVSSSDDASQQGRPIWTFADGEPVPEAFMQVEQEPTSSETILEEIENDAPADGLKDQRLSIENRLDRVRSIMAEIDGDERILLLENEAKETRNLRVNVAKRLSELRDAHEKNQQRQELNRRKEFLYHKAQIVEQILEKRRNQVELKKDIDRFEAKEVAAIAKLKQLKALLAQREADHREACAEWEGRFEPIVDASLAHVGEAKEAVRNAARNSSGVAINKDITRELQGLLSKTLIKSSAELYKQRADLHAFRIELDKRLEELRYNNPGLAQAPRRTAGSIIKLLHEPGDRLVKLSSEFDQRMRGNIVDFKDRIKVLRDEAEWLQSNPGTQAWRDLESELSSVTKRNEMLEKVENAHAFLASWMENKAIRQLDEDVTTRAIIVKKISDEILDEVFKSFVRGVCENVSMLAAAADTICSSSVAFAIAGARYRSSQDTMNLISGDMYASARRAFYMKGDQREVGAAPTLICSERNPIAIPQKENNVRSQCTREILLKKLLMLPQDTMEIDRLIEHERKALDDLAVSPVDGAINLPKSAGQLSLLRFLPRSSAQQSLLVAGTNIGRFVVWSVPWSSGTNKQSPSPTTMVAYSPILPRCEVSPIEELKESPTSPNLLITLDKMNCVRVWTLNPPSRTRRHSGNSFSVKTDKFIPLVPACLFMLTPAELNLPLPPPITNMHVKKRLIDPQVGINPTAVCFHPSCNFAGRNQSIMIGTDGGDLYKINMDFKEPALVAPILHLKPFVTKEFPLAFSQLGQIAQQDNGNCVNSVYREVFHFHKSPIIFLDVLYRASQHLVSIDKAGAIAIWSYKPEQFSGSGWFVPMATSYLDLGFLSHQPLPHNGATSSSGLESYTEKIDCPPQYLIDTLKLWRRRRIYMPPGDSYVILETFFPIIESEECEIQYERVTMVKDTSVESVKSNPLSEDSPRSYVSNKTDTSEESVLWMRQNMRRCLSGSAIHDICLSDDGADIGVVLSTMCYPQSSVYASALEENLRQRAANLEGDPPNAILVGLSLHGVIITLDSKNLLFHQSYVVFELHDGEAIVSMSLGPLQASLRTRIALVQTTSRMRLFCTDTGIEMFPQSGYFPFQCPELPKPSRRQKFPRSLSAVCPLFSMMAFGNNADSTICVYALYHLYEETKNLSNVKLSDTEKSKLRHRLRHVSKLTAMSVRISVAHDVCTFIVNLIVDEVVSAVQKKAEKSKIITEMYGHCHHLGVIPPTSWPSSDAGDSSDALFPRVEDFLHEEEYEEATLSDIPIEKPLEIYSGPSDTVVVNASDAQNETLVPDIEQDEPITHVIEAASLQDSVDPENGLMPDGIDESAQFGSDIFSGARNDVDVANEPIASDTNKELDEELLAGELMSEGIFLAAGTLQDGNDITELEHSGSTVEDYPLPRSSTVEEVGDGGGNQEEEGSNTKHGRSI